MGVVGVEAASCRHLLVLLQAAAGVRCVRTPQRRELLLGGVDLARQPRRSAALRRVRTARQCLHAARVCGAALERERALGSCARGRVGRTGAAFCDRQRGVRRRQRAGVLAEEVERCVALQRYGLHLRAHRRRSLAARGRLALRSLDRPLAARQLVQHATAARCRAGGGQAQLLGAQVERPRKRGNLPRGRGELAAQLRSLPVVLLAQVGQCLSELLLQSEVRGGAAAAARVL